VINRDDFLFILIPQTDRRQQTERRAIWRGSRRAADQHASANPVSTASAAVALWSAAEQGARAAEKPVLH
jgi:hypothetical protein